jgi:hypothetical protein
MSWWSETDDPMSAAEQDRVAVALEPGETALHFVRGRTEGKRTVWVATDRRVVSIGVTWRGRVRPIAFTEIRGVETEEGAHGWTIRLRTGTGRHALVAAHPSLGQPFVEQVVARSGAAASFIASRRPAAASRSSIPAAPPVAAAVADATRVAGFPSGEVLAHLREAADLHRSGALTDDEFTALKRRLLGP